MYLYIQNKQGQEIGQISVSNKYVARCYSLQKRYLGKVLEHGKHLFAFDENENYIGRYDGEYSYNKYNDNLGKGNWVYNFFYPSIDKIQ